MCGSQNSGGSKLVGGSFVCDVKTWPLKRPGLQMSTRELGTQLPSFSALVITSPGPMPMPFGARKPVLTTSSLLPSFDTRSSVP